jgi:hypothetical protein
MIKNIGNIVLLSFLFFTFSCEDYLQAGEKKVLTESEREEKRLKRIKKDNEESRKMYEKIYGKEKWKKMKEESNIHW